MPRSPAPSPKTPTPAIEQVERSNLFRASRLPPMPCALCPMRRSHPLIPLLLAFLVLLVLPAAAMAQFQKVFTPRISVQERYDDNIDLVHTNETSDWITTVTPGFNLAVNTAHTNLSLDVSGGRSFYADDSSRDANRLDSILSLNQQLSSRLSVVATDTFARTEDPIIVQNGVVTYVSPQRRVRYYNTGDAGVTYQLGLENKATVGYRNRLFSSEDNQEEDSLGNEGYFDLLTWFTPRVGTELTGSVLRGTFDQAGSFRGIPTSSFYNYTGAATLNYRWHPTRRAYVRYQMQDADYDHTSVAAGTLDYYVYQGVLGTSLALGPHTTLDAEGGWWLQDPDGGESRDGPVFNVLLTTQQQRLTLRLGGNGGPTLDYFNAQNLGFSKYYLGFASATYQLTSKLSVTGSANYRWQDYYGRDRTDKTWWVSGGPAYQFWHYFTLTLDGTHTERNSTLPVNEWTDNRATLILTWAYGIPF
jgi:hypothetical protein